MKGTLAFVSIAYLALAIIVSAVPAEDSKEKTQAKTSTAATQAASPDEQIANLEAICAASAEARAARHEVTPLFDRLGGEEGIHALTREIVRLHLENESIKYMFEDLDADRVARRVALFVIAGTGGRADAYDGPDLKISHAPMGLTNADFLSAGGDVIQAMKNLGHEQNEIDEVVCILVSLRDQVVLREGGETKKAGY